VSVQSTTGSRGVRISGSNGSNAGYTIFWGRVQDYWLPTPFACFPFTSPTYVTVCHQVPTELYLTAEGTFFLDSVSRFAARDVVREV